MKTSHYALSAPILATTLLLTAAPVAVDAQAGWWEWNLRELSIQVDVRAADAPRYVPGVVYAPAPRYDLRGHRTAPRPRGPEARRRGSEHRGPAFCRSRAGHPVFGRRWCVDKGFGLGEPAYGPLRWERRDWLNALPRMHRIRPLGILSPRDLIDVLGPTVYGRLDRERARLRGASALSGRWIRPDGSSLVLQIRSGPLAVAELTDFGSDGWFDVVLVAGG